MEEFGTLKIYIIVIFILKALHLTEQLKIYSQITKLIQSQSSKIALVIAFKSVLEASLFECATPVHSRCMFCSQQVLAKCTRHIDGSLTMQV